MNEIKLKHVVIAAVVPLLFLSLIVSLNETHRQGEMSFIGILVAIYYSFPVALFTLIYVGVVERLIGLNFRTFVLSILWRVTLALVLGIFVLTIWVFVDGGMYKYNKIGFTAYWLEDFNRYKRAILYFGITVPLTLTIVSRRKRG